MKYLALAAFMMAAPALANTDAWDSVRADLYGDRALHDGTEVIAIDAPYRTPDDARTQLAAHVIAPHGLQIGQVTIVIDENPMPVAAIFSMSTPQKSFFFDVTMRVNGPTPLHVIAETTDGQLWVSEAYVKTSGTGACSAPPGTDPESALLTLGQMSVEMAGSVPGIALGQVSPLEDRLNKLDLDILHPSHSGMQMDQISLLFVPMRYIETVDIDLDGAGYVDMTGSISLSENPRVSLSVPSRTQSVDIKMTDTDGTESHVHKQLAGF